MAPPKPTLTDTLGGPGRYLTHVSTDKPIYRAGETVYLRGTILRADDRTPIPEGGQALGMIEVTGPKVTDLRYVS